jgi:hypothetical protein
MLRILHHIVKKRFITTEGVLTVDKKKPIVESTRKMFALVKAYPTTQRILADKGVLVPWYETFKLQDESKKSLPANFSILTGKFLTHNISDPFRQDPSKRAKLDNKRI